MRPKRPSPRHVWITTFAEYSPSGILLREEGYWYDGPLSQAVAMNHGLVQDNFRIRDDTTTASGGTPNWISTENQATNVVIDVDTTFRIRYTVSCTGGTNWNDNASLYYRIDTGGGFGTWTLTDNTTPIQYDTAASVDDAAGGFTIQSVDFLLTAGTGTAADGAYDEADPITRSGGSNISVQDGRYCEIEVGLTLDSAQVADGDLIEARLYDGNSGSPIPFTDEAGSYTNVPTIEVNEGVAELSAQGAINFYR